MPINQTNSSARSRYLQLLVLVVVAGNIYPLIYLRQNFEVSILQAFNLSATQLGQMYSMLGILYVTTYLPSGWLADRVSPKLLMSFSLAMAGVLGAWFSTYPDFQSLIIIFAGWGIAAGLTFWSALIKATAVLARPQEQGRFFGILDGGRGLVEAVLATIALAIFAYFLSEQGGSNSTEYSLRRVIYLYVACMFVMAPISYFILDDIRSEKPASNEYHSSASLWRDLKSIASKEEVWLCGLCILTGYQLFWATYSFSAYMQTQFGLSAVAVGILTVAKLWTRPIGAVAAGFAGDFSDREKVLAWLLVAASLSLLCLAYVPLGTSTYLLLFIVLAVGFLTYGVRGIFWSTLERANISNRIKGLAIGIISLVGYSPDIYLPLLNGYLLDTYPGRQGYVIYFLILSVAGFLGALGAWRLRVLALRHE